MGLYQELNKYIDKNIYPFHMPGHKRNTNFLSFERDIVNYDITEIHGMDNLHGPKGIIKDLNQRLSKVFGSDESFLMVNGSSGGIIAAIMATVNDGDKLLIARNCHRSIFSGLIYSGATPLYVSPDITPEGLVGGICSGKINQALLTDPDIKAVQITSPTFEGFVSDVETIANIVHKHGKVLIVDEAHGPHYKFSNRFPKTALEQGADIVIQSLHKTLPALTQSAVLHLQGNRVDRERLFNNLSMIQTTSPSYIFMTGIDQCTTFLETKAQESFANYVDTLQNFRKDMLQLKNIRLIGNEITTNNVVKDIDIGKLVFYIEKNISGKEVSRILREDYQVHLELCSPVHFIAMTSVADTQHGFDSLGRGLKDIDKMLDDYKNRQTKTPLLLSPKVALPPRQVLTKKTIEVSLKESIGKISAEFVTPYPPGIPLIAPGEIIEKEIIDRIIQTTDDDVCKDICTRGTLKVLQS